MTGAQQYRGRTIDADTNLDGAWVALVDGEERGRPQHSRTDALREARSSVNRSLGHQGEKRERHAGEIDPSAPEPAYFANLRRTIFEDA